MIDVQTDRTSKNRGPNKSISRSFIQGARQNVTSLHMTINTSYKSSCKYNHLEIIIYIDQVLRKYCEGNLERVR